MTTIKRPEHLKQPVVDNAKPDGPTAHQTGEKLVIDRGDLVPQHDSQMDRAGRSVGGSEVVALGECYVAATGPNRGEVIQQVRDTTTHELVGVPLSKLRRRHGERGCSRPVSRGFRVEDGADAEARRAQRWVEVRPGVRRLVQA